MTRPLNETGVKRLNRQWRRATTGRVALVLANLSNPYNVGSILRTAAVFGVERVWLVGATPDPTHAGVRKTALGTDRALTVTAVADLAGAVDQARAQGFTVVAVELAEGAQPLPTYAVPKATCLVLGNEAHGLPPAALAVCDTAVYVPQLGRVASLNVATAAAIAVYEVRRAGWIRDAAHFDSEAPGVPPSRA